MPPSLIFEVVLAAPTMVPSKNPLQLKILYTKTWENCGFFKYILCEFKDSMEGWHRLCNGITSREGTAEQRNTKGTVLFSHLGSFVFFCPRVYFVCLVYGRVLKSGYTFGNCQR